MKKNKIAPDGATEIRAQLPRVAAATGANAPGEGRSLSSIALHQTFASLCLEVAHSLGRAPLFRRGESLVTVNESTGDVLPMTATRWRSWHQRYFVFHAENKDGERRTVNAPQDKALCILASDQLRAELRELRAVNHLRLPVWRGEGTERRLELLPEGYDDATKTFTVPLLAYDFNWRLEDAQAWLDATFGGFPFYESGELFARRSFSAHVGAMLGIFAVNLLPDGAVRPLIVVSGNQPGLGKTLLVHAQLSPVHSRIEDDSKPKSDEELRNILEAAALAADPYLVLDDAANLQSHDLNRFITSPVHKPRVKGHSLRVRCANVTQVFATGNTLNLTEDLDRRTLVVDLFDPGKAADRIVNSPLTNPFLFSDDYRAKACAAMWALLRHWDTNGFPPCGEAQKPSFEGYASIVGSVLVCAGLANPFGARACRSGGDEAGRALETAICRLAGGAEKDEVFESQEILARLSEDGTLEVVIPFECRDERKALGHKLKKLRGRRFTDTQGRQFLFGKREEAGGSRYTVSFLGRAAE